MRPIGLKLRTSVDAGIDSIHPGVIPIAKARPLVDRSSMVGGGGRHVEGLGMGKTSEL